MNSVSTQLYYLLDGFVKCSVGRYFVITLRQSSLTSASEVNKQITSFGCQAGVGKRRVQGCLLVIIMSLVA